MKVVVKEQEGKTIRIWFPSGLVFNRLSAAILPGILKQNGITVTRQQAAALIKVLNQCRHQFRNWNLAEVQDAAGDTVLIRF